MDNQAARNESPEQLIEVFKAAALSVTKLYKSSVAAETRARSEGYQECLDDLLGFLDREGNRPADAGLSKLRRWIAERHEGGDSTLPSSESEDEVEKSEAAQTNSTGNNNHAAAPVSAATSIAAVAPTVPTSNANSLQQITAQAANNDSAPVEIVPIHNEPHHFIVPSQDNFTFGSDHQYPNIATLDLSDARSHGPIAHHSSRQSRNRSATRSALRASNQLGRGAGTKRRMDFDDFFDGCFGGKDPFGNGPKRRHM